MIPVIIGLTITLNVLLLKDGAQIPKYWVLLDCYLFVSLDPGLKLESTYWDFIVLGSSISSFVVLIFERKGNFSGSRVQAVKVLDK